MVTSVVMFRKKQKIGGFEVKKSIAALAPLKNKLQHRQLHASAQLAHVVNRMFVTLEGRGILRACTEEFMLAARSKKDDPLAAEFIRTFRLQNFYENFYLDYYESLKTGNSRVRSITIPKKDSPKVDFDEVAAYGYRAPHPDLSECFADSARTGSSRMSLR